MNNLNEKLESYHQSKAVLDENNQDLKKNHIELQKLNQQANETRQALDILNKKLQFADQELATGKLTTDGFLAIKEDIARQESTFNILNDAIKAQENARSIILDTRSQSQSILNECRRSVAAQLSQSLLVEIAEQPLFKDLIDSFIGSQPAAKLMSADGREGVFIGLGRKLVEACLFDPKNGRGATPSVQQTYERVDEMILNLK